MHKRFDSLTHCYHIQYHKKLYKVLYNATQKKLKMIKLKWEIKSTLANKNYTGTDIKNKQTNENHMHT